MKDIEVSLNLPLSKELKREIEIEMADHINCESKSTSNYANEIHLKLTSPAVLRKLAAPFLTDQVVSTLCRKPDKAELRSLAWLFAWFILVLLSDYIAGSRGWTDYWKYENARHALKEQVIDQTALAWLLSGIARAGFFSQFAVTIIAAYKSGFGVMVARVIQLKLIHTLLVICGYYLLPHQFFFRGEEVLLTEWQFGKYFGGIVLSAVIIPAALIVLITSRYRLWPISVFLVLALAFLYQGAPQIGVMNRLVFENLKNGELMELSFVEQISLPGAAFEGRRNYSAAWFRHNKKLISSTEVERWWTMPWIDDGAGLGWLAVPIPFLAIFSLLAMWWLLGKRSPMDGVLYGVIALLAVFATIGPFVSLVYGSTYLNSLNALGISPPFVAFHHFFYDGVYPENRLLAFAFVFSAFLPWLMVGLFARSTRREAVAAAQD